MSGLHDTLSKPGFWLLTWGPGPLLWRLARLLGWIGFLLRVGWVPPLAGLIALFLGVHLLFLKNWATRKDVTAQRALLSKGEKNHASIKSAETGKCFIDCPVPLLYHHAWGRKLRASQCNACCYAKHAGIALYVARSISFFTH